MDLQFSQLWCNLSVSCYIHENNKCVSLTIAVLPFVPESPRYSVAAGNEAAAKQTLRKIYGPALSEDFIESEISKVEEDLKVGRDGKYSDLFKKRHLPPLLVGKYTSSFSYTR